MLPSVKYSKRLSEIYLHQRGVLSRRNGIVDPTRAVSTLVSSSSFQSPITSTSASSLLGSLDSKCDHSNKYHFQRNFQISSHLGNVRLFSTTTDDAKTNDTTATTTTTTTTTTNKTSSDVTDNEETTTLEFQAETRQLLDIVINSLYTDKDVFVRELVSNASDALEKLRHIQATNAVTLDPTFADLPLEIRIDLDEVQSTITITDTGIGMTREEMIRNLGTIARSGSKNFVRGLEANQIAEDPNSLTFGTDVASSIIGQFGVGFYSSFMVSDKVEVRSRSSIMTGEDSTVTPVTHVWTSDGVMGNYTISKLNDDDIRQDRGTSVVLHITPKQWEYVSETKLESILKRYSNFINFPIYLNGKRINTQKALWTVDPKEVTQEEYVEFYKYFANALDVPLDIYHFRADAPIEMKVLFFIPTFHNEKYGMGRMEPGVNLYSRKVLIESKSPDIVPDWMRFVKGIVDSEDLPLAISREKAQDTALIQKLRKTLVRKFIAHLTNLKKKDPKSFIKTFYEEYSFFIKEGICQDYEFQAQLSKLLHFQTSKSSDLISLDEYISNMRPEQQDIYYLIAPSRTAALQSPYLEVFNKANVEVFIMFSSLEDFVMANLEKYEGRKLISVEKSDIDLSTFTAKKSDDKDDDKKDDSNKDDVDTNENSTRTLTSTEVTEFCEWFRNTAIGDYKVATCKSTNRLTSSPAIVTDNESGSIRRMMRLIDASSQDGSSNRENAMPLPAQNVLINPNHTVIIGIYDLIHTEPMLAKVLAQQIYDNCLVAAGLLDDSRSMLPRINDILLCVINGAKDRPVAESESSTTKPKVVPEEVSTDNSQQTGAANVKESMSTTKGDQKSSTTVDAEYVEK